MTFEPMSPAGQLLIFEVKVVELLLLIFESSALSMPQLMMHHRVSLFPCLSFNHLLMAETPTPKQTIKAPSRLVHWTVSAGSQMTCKAKAITMSIVLERETRLASSTLRATVRQSCSKTPQIPLPISHPISCRCLRHSQSL